MTPILFLLDMIARSLNLGWNQVRFTSHSDAVVVTPYSLILPNQCSYRWGPPWGSSPRTSVFNLKNSFATYIYKDISYRNVEAVHFLIETNGTICLCRELTSSFPRWERIRSTVQPVSSIWIRLPSASQHAHDPIRL